MDIKSTLHKLYVKGDYAHKKKVYDSLDQDVAFERFAKRIENNGHTISLDSRKVNDGKESKSRRRIIGYAAMVASVLLPIIVLSAVLLTNRNDADNLLSETMPGTSLAYIETSNGDVISLDSASLNIDEDGIKATVANGELEIESTDDIEMTSIRIPRGGEYKLTLPDGTKVHLNSDSKLTFPTRFTGNSRDVELVGEAYFEVSHSDDNPFIVHIGNISVKQYGTHFNINAYKGKCKTITLIEGSIGVTAGNNSECRLTPGRQACINGDEIRLCNADIDAVMGWTEGMFKFDGENLADIATTLSRWYNVDICVDASLSQCCFTGSLSRESTLSDILEAICEITNTSVTTKDNTIKIRK